MAGYAGRFLHVFRGLKFAGLSYQPFHWPNCNVLSRIGSGVKNIKGNRQKRTTSRRGWSTHNK